MSFPEIIEENQPIEIAQEAAKVLSGKISGIRFIVLFGSLVSGDENFGDDRYQLNVSKEQDIDLLIVMNEWEESWEGDDATCTQAWLRATVNP